MSLIGTFFFFMLEDLVNADRDCEHLGACLENQDTCEKSLAMVNIIGGGGVQNKCLENCNRTL